MNAGLLTPLATFFGLICASVFAAIIGIIAWDYQVRKKKEINLRIETFKDIYKLANYFTKEPDPNKPVDIEMLSDKIGLNLRICGNKNEWDSYREFNNSIVELRDNKSRDEEKNLKTDAKKKLDKLNDLVIAVLRKEIGKNPLPDEDNKKNHSNIS